MTYSIDIINQFIDFASKNTKLSLYSSISNISIKTLNKWYTIYYDFIINKKPITERIKSYEIHGLSKKHLYINKILKYVNDYTGNGLKSIYTFLKKSIAKKHTFLKKVLQKSHKKFKTHIIPKTIEQITF